MSVPSRSFRRGERVRYVPSHARGNYHHQHCEDGVVSSTNDQWVFVKYGTPLPHASRTAAATDPRHLVRLSEIEE